MTTDGGPAGHLGFPTGDQLPIAGGLVSYFDGHSCGAWRGRENSGSAIYSSSAGVRTVHGCIYKKYQELGGPEGSPRSNLGFPTTNEAQILGGAVSYFAGNGCGTAGPNNEGSAIYAGPGGIHNVQGCIYKFYREKGATTNARLGWPVSDEETIPNGWVSYVQGGQPCDGGGK